jgi:hypothetical protein
MFRPATLAFAVLVASSGSLSAQSPEPADWAISSWDLPLLRPLPPGLDSATLLDLEYERTDSIIGTAVDLNADGTPDLLIESARSLCGASGNCSFVIVDGRSRRSLGTIGGNRLFFRQRRINAWPVVQTWWHMSAGSGLYSTYVFDGTQYVQLAAVSVEGDGLQSLFRQLDSVRTRSLR